MICLTCVGCLKLSPGLGQNRQEDHIGANEYATHHVRCPAQGISS